MKITKTTFNSTDTLFKSTNKGDQPSMKSLSSNKKQKKIMEVRSRNEEEKKAIS